MQDVVNHQLVNHQLIFCFHDAFNLAQWDNLLQMIWDDPDTFHFFNTLSSISDTKKKVGNDILEHCQCSGKIKISSAVRSPSGLHYNLLVSYLKIND